MKKNIVGKKPEKTRPDTRPISSRGWAGTVMRVDSSSTDKGGGCDVARQGQ